VDNLPFNPLGIPDGAAIELDLGDAGRIIFGVTGNRYDITFVDALLDDDGQKGSLHLSLPHNATVALAMLINQGIGLGDPSLTYEKIEKNWEATEASTPDAGADVGQVPATPSEGGSSEPQG